MRSARRSLWTISAFLLASGLAACSATAAPTAANPASVSATASTLNTPTTAHGPSPATPPVAPSAAAGAEALRPGWHQLGWLVPGSASGPTIATLAIDPATPTTLYVGTLYTVDNHIGVYRSGDRGATWQPAGQGLPTPTDGTGIEKLLIDTQHPGTLYAIGHFDGIWRSDDQGAGWRLAGLKSGSVNALVLDPRSPGRLYALTSDGPQRSADGGATWLPINAGVPDHTSVGFMSLLIDPQQPDTLYLGASFGGVYRSTDSGQHWNTVNSGLPDQPVLDGLALDPQHPGTLYVSITGAGLYRSADAGQHWEQASPQEYSAITPAADALYAVLDGALARSADRGKTWRPVADVACSAQALASTPSDGVIVGCLDGRVYVLQTS